MPRVMISYYTFTPTKEEALSIAMKARREGKRSEIIDNDEKLTIMDRMGNMQDLIQWAKDNDVEFDKSMLLKQ